MSHQSTPVHHSAATLPEDGLWSHKFRPDPSHDSVTSPATDLRETANMYYIELELPGIDGSRNIRLHWLDGNTLQIKATIHKTNLESVWGNNHPNNNSQKHAVHDRIAGKECDGRNCPGENVLSHRRGQETGQVASTMTCWLNERKAGAFMRNISFSVSVDMDGVQARLSEGLLMIMVPKKDANALDDKDIYIESA
jgi:HSP20 family molecular chaperone IbpA